MDKLNNRNNHRKCSKCGKTRAEDMSVTYHRFPKPGIMNYCENVTKARAWAKYCWPNKDWSSLDSLKSLHIQNKVLCGRHFHSSQFYDSERQKLNKFAVPESSEVEELLQAREINFDQDKMTKEDIIKGSTGKVLNFDHLTFWVANAKTASSYFVTRFGFKPLAFRGSTEERPVVSYAVQLNKITIIFESPLSNDNEISKDLVAHGDFVKDVAFEVSDLEAIVEKAKKEGAVVVKDVTEEDDKDGIIKYAILKTYGDNTHTLIDRSKYKGLLFPGYEALEDDPLNKLLPETNLYFVDHVEGNMADGTLEDSVSWYEKNLNMHRFWCVDYSHDLVPYSCINSASVINQSETVLLSLNEAAKGIRPTSKASEFVKALGASGVEHVAFYTDDIVSTMKSLKTRGADVLSWPPTYYDMIKEKLKDSPVSVAESIEELKEQNILIDFDERGYMLQAFTKHLQVRPTLFIEIIQRRNHRGFGAMNYKWVFEAIELMDKKSTED